MKSVSKFCYNFDDFTLPKFGKESHPQTWPKVFPVSAKVAVKSPTPVCSSSAKLKPKAAALQVLFKKSSSEAAAQVKAAIQDAFKLVPPADFRKAAKKKPSKVVPVKAPWKVVKRAKAAKVPVKEAKGGKQAAPSLQRESKASALESALQASFQLRPLYYRFLTVWAAVKSVHNIQISEGDHDSVSD